MTRICNQENQKRSEEIAQGKARALSPNLYAVNDLFILKITEPERISMSEYWNGKDGKLIEIFISHWWGEDFGEFCQSTSRFATGYIAKKGANLSPEDIKQQAMALAFYVCAFSNNQWNLAAEMGSSVEDTPFYKVLDADTTKVMAMNLDQCATPLQRAWCAFEFYFIHKLGKDFMINTRFGAMDRADSDSSLIVMWLLHMYKVLQDMNIDKSQASCLKDLNMIREEISHFKGTGIVEGQTGSDALDRTLRLSPTKPSPSRVTPLPSRLRSRMAGIRTPRIIMAFARWHT